MSKAKYYLWRGIEYPTVTDLMQAIHASVGLTPGRRLNAGTAARVCRETNAEIDKVQFWQNGRLQPMKRIGGRK